VTLFILPVKIYMIVYETEFYYILKIFAHINLPRR